MTENENKNVNMPDESAALADAKKIALAAAHVLDTKKARDIKILCINEKTIIADYFVIAMGTSTTQVNSLAGEVEYKLGEISAFTPREPREREAERGCFSTTTALLSTCSAERRENSTSSISSGQTQRKCRLTLLPRNNSVIYC